MLCCSVFWLWLAMLISVLCHVLCLPSSCSAMVDFAALCHAILDWTLLCEAFPYFALLCTALLYLVCLLYKYFVLLSSDWLYIALLCFDLLCNALLFTALLCFALLCIALLLLAHPLCYMSPSSQLENDELKFASQRRVKSQRLLVNKAPRFETRKMKESQ